MIRRISVFYDGSCEPFNPGGRMGWGFVVYEDGKRIHEGQDGVQEHECNTNNVAEYQAVSMALQWLVDQGLTGAQVRMHGDSLLTVNQMNGRWKFKGGLYGMQYRIALELKKKFEDICFTWIPRDKNTEADELSKATSTLRKEN